MKLYGDTAHLDWKESDQVCEALRKVTYRGVVADRAHLSDNKPTLLGYADLDKDHYKIYVVNPRSPKKAIIKFDTSYIWVGNLDVPFYECGLKVIKPADCIRGKEIAETLGLEP